jgi:hypothetical protein
VCGGELLAVTAADRRVAWRRPARQVASSPGGRWLVTTGDDELSWLEPASGQPLRSVPLPGQLSARPVVTDGGVVLVPLVNGELVAVSPKEEPPWRARISGSPLWAPHYHEPSGRIVVASGNGVVAAIDLQRRSPALTPPSGSGGPAVAPLSPGPPAELPGSAGGAGPAPSVSPPASGGGA